MLLLSIKPLHSSFNVTIFQMLETLSINVVNVLMHRPFSPAVVSQEFSDRVSTLSIEYQWVS